jgi:cysteinyl-tRNA synthetase
MAPVCCTKQAVCAGCAVDSEKMSKSLGNFFTIREVLRLHHPLTIRWFLLNTHYRQPVNYTERNLLEVTK